jgi:hypothetical protein
VLRVLEREHGDEDVTEAIAFVGMAMTSVRGIRVIIGVSSLAVRYHARGQCSIYIVLQPHRKRAANLEGFDVIRGTL